MFTITADTSRLYRYALWMSIFTIGYNLLEGAISTFFGYADDSLALFGFGLDSFIESISAIGILRMVQRIQKNPESHRTPFEKQALRITGWSFYALAGVLLLSAAINIYLGKKPETALHGIIITGISILFMWAMIWTKERLGNALGSKPILADAACARVCIFMSVIVMASSGIYALTGFPYADSIGALGLVYFSFREGRECFGKAKGMGCGCH